MQKYILDYFEYYNSPNMVEEMEYINKLYEGLIISYPQDIVKQYIDSTLKGCVYIKKVNDTHFLVDLNLKKFSNGTLLSDMLTKVEDTYGWVVNSYKTIFGSDVSSYNGDVQIDISKYDRIVFQIECIHPLKIQNVINIPDILYHISPAKYKERILSKGIIPKFNNKAFKHPDRVYLFDDIKDASNIVYNLSSYEEATTWVVYAIDGKLFRSVNCELFIDPLYVMDNGMSYFTKRNISPQWIISTKYL